MWQRIIKGKLIQKASISVGAVTNYSLPLTGTYSVADEYSATYLIEQNLTGVYDID